ncbi:MAG TPA: DoxX family protein [Caulobacteraceae bacterium]|nr:DoxX family protein [Caulobacteraceae bacterium]
MIQRPDDHARLRVTLRLLLVAIYLGVGALHLHAANSFLAIMPPFIPAPRLVILFTGGCEIAGAVGLLIPRTRWLAGLMLAIYALCVWPANIYQALWRIHAPPLPDSWWYHGPRLAFQPVLMWWALFAGGVTRWPFRRN